MMTIIGLPYPCPAPFILPWPLITIPSITSSKGTVTATTPSITTPSTTTSSTTTPSRATPSSTTTTSTTFATKKRRPPATCATCAFAQSKNQILLPCAHSYCTPCFTALIATSLSPSNLTSDFPPTCPLSHLITSPTSVHSPSPNSFTLPIPTTLIKTHCPRPLYQRYLTLTFRLSIPPLQSWCCPNPACASLNDRRKMCTVFSAVRCKKCKTWGCLKCEKRRRLPGWHRCESKAWKVDPEGLARGLRVLEEEENIREERRRVEGLGSEEESSGTESERDGSQELGSNSDEEETGQGRMRGTVERKGRRREEYGGCTQVDSEEDSDLESRTGF